jgi:hypothetical protein
MNDQQQTGSTSAPEPRVQITASVDYTLSVPASWVEDEDFLADPGEAVFTWIVDKNQCISGIDLMDHTVWPERKQACAAEPELRAEREQDGGR